MTLVTCGLWLGATPTARLVPTRPREGRHALSVGGCDGHWTRSLAERRAQHRAADGVLGSLMPWPRGATRTGTARHKRFRLIVLRRAGYRCELRLNVCIDTANIADHIIPVAEGGPEFDPANGQAACQPCHDAKTRAEAARGRARRRAARKRPSETHPGGISPHA